jgi:hypothetical protein
VACDRLEFTIWEWIFAELHHDEEAIAWACAHVPALMMVERVEILGEGVVAMYTQLVHDQGREQATLVRSDDGFADFVIRRRVFRNGPPPPPQVAALFHTPEPWECRVKYSDDERT